MPHLRRQPNPHDQLVQGGTAGSLRTQFQTPPARHPPSNPTRVPPSTGPHEITPDAVPAMAPTSGYPNPFNIFGRRFGQNPPPPPEQPEDDEDVFDDADEDFDPNALDISQGNYEDELGSDGQIESEEGLEDTAEVDPEELEEMVEGEDELQDEDEDMDRERSESPLPPNLREISSLASWTVSTSKPGCGVAALRNPSSSQYWQSDGPQPHILTLHFFKLVAIVRIRVFLDFNLDESYTPTKMIFLAGMGGNDLVEFATWEGENPHGWEDVSLEGVGGRNGGWVREDITRQRRRSKSQRDADGDSESDPGDTDLDEKLRKEPHYGNVLKAMVIQMRVMENHQNGKDTHVRGFQVFASDGTRTTMTAPSASADARDRHRRHSARQSLRAGSHHNRVGSEDPVLPRPVSPSGLEEPEWMGEPVIR